MKRGTVLSRFGETFYTLLATAMVLPLFSQEAAASIDYFDLNPAQLLEAQVLSVSKKEETVAQSPAAIYVVTSEDIMRSGVTNIPDALRMVPGVHVAQADSNSWAISIRGFNSVLANKLLVLIDGRTIYNPVFGGVLWEAHDLMLEDIERIEVIRGPGGTLWGANAVNGIINILTKDARNTQGTLTSALYGNEEQGTLSARHGGTLGENGFYRVYAKGFNRDSSRRPGGGDTYDEWDGMRGGFRADWEEFTLQGDAYRTDTEQRRPLFQLSAPFKNPTNQTIVYEGVNLLGRWTKKQEDGSQLSLQSYIDWAKRDEPINFIDNRIIADMEAQYNFAPMGSHEVIAGLGYRFSVDDKEGDINVGFSPKRRRDNLYSAFVQDKITLMEDVSFLTLGSKFEHNGFTGFEVQPSARFQYNPSVSENIWAAVSRAVRTPTPVEEDLTSTIDMAAFVRAAFVPNKNFKSEELVSYELGYRNQITPALSTDVAFFYNQYDNLGTTGFLTPRLINNGIDPLHILLPVQFQNDMRGQSHGIEIATSWAVDPDLKITANYSFMNLSLKSADDSEEAGEDLYPVHQAGVRASWNISENWMLDASASYVDELQGSNVGDYVRLDVNLGWQLNDQIRLNLVGQNLMDSSNREFGNESDINAGEIERSVIGKLTWEF